MSSPPSRISGALSGHYLTRDGSRIVVPIDQAQGYQLVVVPNWITEFRERMAASRAR